MSHWYSPEGILVTAVERADGNGDRPPTVRDARKLGLLPSVTTILQVLEKPALTEWKVEQAILAALTLPGIDGESMDERMARIREDMKAQSERAMEFGNIIHNAIATYGTTGRVVLAEYPEYVEPVVRWMDDEQVRGTHEAAMATDDYAGTIDFYGSTRMFRHVLIDFKTQATRPGKKIKVYDEWAYQLAAYRAMVGYDYDCVNVIISSTEPGRIAEHVWDAEYMVKAEKVFNHILKIFKISKGL